MRVKIEPRLRQATLILLTVGALSVRESVANGTEWTIGKGFRQVGVIVPQAGRTGFILLDPSVTGITFTNRLSDEHAGENQIRLNGSGVTAGDIDGDGLWDLYFG